MPRKDGTQPSGHAKRERARLKRAAPQVDEWAARYEEIGPPPIDGAQRVEWGNLIAANIAYEQLVAPDIRTPSERKLVLEAVRTLGMTAVKALYEQRLKRVEGTLYGGAVREELDEVDGLEPDPTARPVS